MTSHHWMTLISSVVFAAIVLGLIAWGWSARKRRQSGTAPLPEIPEHLDGAEPEFAADAQYVSTTRAGDWLDRILAHGLGAKGTAQAMVFPEGLMVARDGAPDLWIPAERISVLRRESGMAGKFVEKDGLAVITWSLGEQAVDTGLRTRRGEDTAALLDALRAVAPHAADRLPEDHLPAEQPTRHQPEGDRPAAGAR